jgi:hypothetical protein
LTWRLLFFLQKATSACLFNHSIMVAVAVPILRIAPLDGESEQRFFAF